MGCATDRISADLLADCLNLTVAGIEADVILIPLKDIDKTASTLDPVNPQLCTKLQLKPGTTGFKLEGVKQLNGYNYEFVRGDQQTMDKWRHTFSGVIMTPSTTNRAEANKMAKGESYVIVINKKWKGANDADAFLVLGWDAGLYVTEMTENSRENNAAILFTLASVDEMLENNMPKNLLETDYPTTLTAFGNKFLQAPLP